VAQDPLTVLVVDDHAAFRAAARRMLEAAGFAVVGEAGDAAQALAAIAAAAPEVVVLDIQLPGVDGIALAERLAAAAAPPRVVLISSRDADSYGERLERAPACGFIPKSRLSGAAVAALCGR
jgi:DNA-binding NarL/FixJ family response regulator